MFKEKFKDGIISAKQFNREDIEYTSEYLILSAGGKTYPAYVRNPGHIPS